MPHTFVPPPDIGHFRLERRLGSGATADVWLARDTLLDRVVALKIASAPASGEMRTRFRVEARAVARMQHPNVVAVHHVGEIAERPFLVTEYLSGRSLDELDSPVPAERVVAIGIDLARGLSAAHRAGVLHRDIKPANAFLADDGVAKLLDFGLAKLDDAPRAFAGTSSSVHDAASSPALAATDIGTTLSGRVAGTPLYMAPETWRGETATRPTDVYSLGALLFELLAGKPPCSTTSLHELCDRVLAGRIDDLALLAPSAPVPLVNLVTQCLRVDPEERPTADALCHALARVVTPPASTRADELDDPRENPYRGLRPFGPEHRALFFGREAETVAVTAELRANPFVLIAGPSGTGKSSLVRAGVIPRVERGVLGAGASWQAVVLVPGRRPIEALAQAVAPVLGMSEGDALAELAKSHTWLAAELRTIAPRVLLVIDQLEEVWTLAPEPERRAFFAILAALALSARTVRAIATVRSDFLARIEDMRDLQAHAVRALVVLHPMAHDGLRRAIVDPAARRGVAMEPALVERLVQGADGGSLPLLEFALGELYARRDTTKGTIGLSDLDALGGMAGALATHADATLARLPVAQRQEARRLLLALVTAEGTRARREEPDLLGR